MRYKRLWWHLSAVTALAAGVVICSPYGHQRHLPYKGVAYTVEIQAPVDSVFRYLGHSERVGEWSVFVKGIRLLNGDQVADGAVGCKRQPYNEEKGVVWDETITQVALDSLRQLTTENFHGFAMTANGLATEQRYTAISPGRTRLTFTLFFLNGRPSFYEECKMYVAAFRVKNIYRRNLENIRRNLEAAR